MKKRKGPHASTRIRKGSIIRSALRCFSEIGFSATTMEDIRQHSGASTGSIYHHFKGKDQLAAEVYIEGIREYQAGLVEVFQSEEDAREGIRRLVGHHLRWVEENIEWSRYLFRNRFSAFLASTEEALSTMNRDLAESSSAWFGRHIRAGELRRMPTDIIIALILGPCMEHTRQYLEGLTATRTDRAVRELADAIWRAIAVHADEA
ncbi:MAG TPA: TetR/AcrR family transcriptional regulator [Deltaproteobacteria bacterium]|nr:TetR/AcrR family transcriptional regulator [Deltaproteobacteria bacterium]HQI82319.1 TetR/AcrR family transcriptional regulator [Deltaproteobacteria bacterium]